MPSVITLWRSASEKVRLRGLAWHYYLSVVKCCATATAIVWFYSLFMTTEPLPAAQSTVTTALVYSRSNTPDAFSLQ